MTVTVKMTTTVKMTVKTTRGGRAPKKRQPTTEVGGV
jgi:hypothetical protein